jgi:predicted outer membrane protein
MTNTMRTLPVAGLLLLLAACQSPVAQPAAASSASPTEVAFTTNAFQIIEFDRQEGKLAQTQARNPRVKALAQQFTNEANDFAAQLTPLAANAGIKPPAVLRNDLRVRLGHMQLQQGLDFDRTYIADQIASHEEEVLMQDSVGTGDISPPFANLMQKGQSLIRRNLDTLRALQAELGTGRR